MRTLTSLMLFATLALRFEAASAQTDPSRPAYYREWLQAQVDEWSVVSAVRLRETSLRTLDGPSGVQTARLSADVTVYPGDREATRTIVAAEVNGRRVPEERLEELAGRWSRFVSDLGRESTAFGDLRMRLLRLTRPTGRPTKESLDGQDVYRVDLVSTAARLRVDRITLWFGASDGRLVKSRVIFAPRAQRASLIVESRYRRIDRLDVPVLRKIEATVQQKRRLRLFTTIVTVDTSFEDFRVERTR